MPAMQQRLLGRTGLSVSVVGIGTNQLRRVPERQAVETLLRAFELGVNLVNFEPDYEGAEDLVATALRAHGASPRIHLSVQAGGHAADVERTLDRLCGKFGRDRIDLYGVTSISQAELLGAEVWGRGGLVELLLRLKAEKRVRGIFASDHGAPHQTLALLERDAFDALMLAYNPLGFHIGTFRAETLYTFETPPSGLQGRYECEDLRRTGAEILPTAARRGVAVMVMKPLAGGLLAQGKAFASLAWREGLPPPPRAVDVLRFVLGHEGVTCVVPGMASPEEVEENVGAGQDPRLSAEAASVLEARIRDLSRVLCSRCGHCDDLCSRRMPVSYLFRAAQHYLYPTVPFGISRTLQYFRLLSSDQPPCLGCRDQSCRCPAGLDIPRELGAAHAAMLDLRSRGLVPAAEALSVDWATGKAFSAFVVSCEAPERLVADGQGIIRLHVRNTGEKGWLRPGGAGGPPVVLRAALDGRRLAEVRARVEVAPRDECHFAVALRAPARAGRYRLHLSLHVSLPEAGASPLLERQSDLEVDGEAGWWAHARGLARRWMGRA